MSKGQYAVYELRQIQSKIISALEGKRIIERNCKKIGDQRKEGKMVGSHVPIGYIA